MESGYNATVIKNDVLSDSLCVLAIKPDFQLGDFKPGQFGVLGLKAKEKRFGGSPDPKTIDDPEKMIKKAYSILSSPIQLDYLEFYIALVPGGELTPRLFALKSGDRVFLGNKITGKFTLDKVPAHKNLLMIGTGTGLAPFMSMVRTNLICGSTRHFVVLHGVRYSHELGFYSELSVLNNNCSNFHYIPVVSRPDQDKNWGGPKGRVTQVIQEKLIEERTGLALTPENFDVLLCGNPSMIQDMTQYLESIGFAQNNEKNKDGQIHTEKYW